METLQNRCIKLWKEKGLSDEQINDGISMLNPIAIANNKQISDKQILDNAYYPCIWGGLGRALLQYIHWESKQY